MITARNKGRLAITAAAVGAALALAGCASGNPLASGSSGGTGASSSTDTSTIVVGSQAYYSNEIVAEIYSQALEHAGYTVQRKFQIGQRDAYIPSLESGEVNVFPEYTGNLLQFYDKKAKAQSQEEVYSALKAALPKSLTVLDEASAQDQDSYNVTKAFADKYGLTSIADLAKVDVPLTLGGNAELEKRPYGPTGLKGTYGVTVANFSATGDTTVDALVAGSVNVADVFSADPSIKSKNLVTLKDPKGLILVQNVVPVVTAGLAGKVGKTLNPISAKLTTPELIAMDVQSVNDKKSSADIAKAWLTTNGFLS